MSAYTYAIGTTALTFTAPTYTTSPYTCNDETVTYALKTQADADPPTGYITFDTSTRVASVHTTTTSLHNTSVNLRIKITRNQSAQTTNLDFSLTLTNPCLTTTITTSSVTISQITTTVNVPFPTS